MAINDRLAEGNDRLPLTMANTRQKIGTSTGPFLLTADYDLPLAELVAAGNYDYVSSDITEEHFRVGWGEQDIESLLMHLHRPTLTDVTRVGVTEAILVHLGRVMDNTDVLHELDRRGLRAGTIRELAALGEQYPDPQFYFPILALRSVLYRRRFGCLWLNDDCRALKLHLYRGLWAANYRFLAFTTDSLRDDDSSPKRGDRRFRPFDGTLEWIEG